jgi:hypothetical protein
MNAINVECAIALVEARFSASRPEELAGFGVAAIWVKLSVSFHDDDITSGRFASVD